MSNRISNIFVTVDTVILRKASISAEVLLIERKNSPFQGQWAIPGGFVDENEDLAQAAARELKEETGLTNIDLQQLHTFGAPRRDPRGHMISVAYYGWCQQNCTAIANDDAANVQWFSIDELPALAFDHDQIIAQAILKLKELK